MARQLFFLFVVFIAQANAYAQLAIGIEPFFRGSAGRISSTYGIGLCIDHKVGNYFFRSGFSITSPQRFSGTATINAFDSAAAPSSINIPIEQTVTDYVLHLGGGASLNPKQKSNYFVATFGLRGIFRNINIDYRESFDESRYNTGDIDRQPYIPVALNIGMNVGLGYWYQLNYMVLFPNFSFGFGSGDYRNKHPWNDFPSYIELGCRILITKNN